MRRACAIRLREVARSDLTADQGVRSVLGCGPGVGILAGNPRPEAHAWHLQIARLHATEIACGPTHQPEEHALLGDMVNSAQVMTLACVRRRCASGDVSHCAGRYVTCSEFNRRHCEVSIDFKRKGELHFLRLNFPEGNRLHQGACMKFFSGFAKTKAPVRSEAKMQPTSSAWHAVSIVAKSSGCEAARALRTTRFLSGAAPRLPLGDCAMGRECSCAYKHHSDRRGQPRRKEELRGMPQNAKIAQERRSESTRRRIDA